MLGVVTVGRQGITKGAQRTTAVVIAAQHPALAILIAFVGPQIDHSPRLQGVAHGVQERLKAKCRIPRYPADLQVGIIALQLQQLRRGIGQLG